MKGVQVVAGGEGPEYVVIGHVTRDCLPDGTAVLGGTATYSAISARRLGLRVAVVTSCAANEPLLALLLDEGIEIHNIPAPATTTFRNTYDNKGNRVQIVGSIAGRLTANSIPHTYLDAEIIHLGPVAQEVDIGVLSAFRRPRLVGVTPQGWLRRWSTEGRVVQSPLPIPDELLGLPANALPVLSMEDLIHDATLAEQYAAPASQIVITQGANSALVYRNGKLAAEVPACTARAVDPTGAGDVFAATLFVYYTETGNLEKSVRFAHQAAAHAIERRGVGGIPTREILQSTVRVQT